jgi:hypothetical protein
MIYQNDNFNIIAFIWAQNDKNSKPTSNDIQFGKELATKTQTGLL